MLRTSTAAKAVAVVASGALHAAAFVAAVPRAGPGRGEGADHEVPFVLENAEDPLPPVPPAPTPESPQTPAPEQSLPVRPPARVPRPASEPHALASAETIVRAEAPSAIARSPGDEPPRFVMVFGQAASARAVVGAASAHRGSATGEDAILPVEDATTPARLLASFPPHYPIAARANGIEADVRLELVVDSEGRVQSTRVLAPRNGDFDAAALDAVARYRFAPATFRGRPARVRMKWSVEFRLK